MGVFFSNLDKWLEINNYFTPGEKRVNILADKYSLRNCLFFHMEIIYFTIPVKFKSSVFLRYLYVCVYIYLLQNHIEQRAKFYLWKY